MSRLKTKEDVVRHLHETAYLIRGDFGDYHIYKIILQEDKRPAESIDDNEFCFHHAANPLPEGESEIGYLDSDVLVTDFEETKEALQQQTNTIRVSENPAGYTVGIYKGNVVSGLTELDKEQFQWKNNESYQGIIDREISLDSIFRQAIESGWITEHEMLTVFFSMPLKGYVFACGNYKLGNWNLEGTMKGFA